MGRSLWSLRKLCPGPLAKIRLFYVYALLFIRGVRGRHQSARAKRIWLTIGDTPREWWVADVSELGALWEIFIARQYDDYLPRHAELILDIGANTGAAAAWFRAHYPAARIVAVEPNPNTVQRLRRNVGVDEGVEVVHGALTDSDGAVHFAADRLSMMGRLVPSASPDTEAVSGFTLASLLDRFAPHATVDLLKMDTEGGEWKILEQPLDLVRAVVLEIHEPTPDGRRPDEILEGVARRGGFELCRGRWPAVRWLLRDRESRGHARSFDRRESAADGFTSPDAPASVGGSERDGQRC
jgi:FkbM family methyltransferase